MVYHKVIRHHLWSRNDGLGRAATGSDQNTTNSQPPPMKQKTKRISTMTLAALAFGVWLCERRLGTVMLVLTAAFAFTRVMAGVHYPTDVVAGALIGGLAVYLPYRHWAGLDRLKTYTIRLAKRFGLT